ncbi:hypothetical protein [Hoeflea sp. TYP-13]|uniref:hypothetical protein n=1 Tax=Hoeflea sp. TYP-13 TaxID=3230023 RepID=UPI0034C674E7
MRKYMWLTFEAGGIALSVVPETLACILLSDPQTPGGHAKRLQLPSSTTSRRGRFSMRFICIAVAAAAVLSGCAKSPESIAPAYVSTTTYSGWSCSQLKREATHLDNALASASAQQEKARGNDVAGVIFIGLPVSTLSGDNIAPQIANLKGQKEAVRKGCR